MAKRRRVWGELVFTALGAIVLALGLFCLGLAASNTDIASRLASEGREAQGMILDLSVKSDGAGATRFGDPEFAPIYRVTYRFEDEAGVGHEATRQVPIRFFNAHKAGGAISVTYLPSDPDLSQVDASTVTSSVLSLLFMGGLSAALGALVLLVEAWRAFVGRRPDSFFWE